MLAHWAPPDERSRMTNLIFSGIPLGSALTMVTGGYLIHYLGWPSLFYTVGVCTLVWFILWSFLVYSQPSEHPRISENELQAIEGSLQGQTNKVRIQSSQLSKLFS